MNRSRHKLCLFVLLLVFAFLSISIPASAEQTTLAEPTAAGPEASPLPTPQAEMIECDNHSWTLVPAVEPTCTQPGFTEGSQCSFCGVYEIEPTEIPAPGHVTVTDLAIAPSCTLSGLTEGSHCEICAEVITAQTEVPAAGHVPATDPAVAPSCTLPGLTEGSHCAVCAEVITAQTEVPATGHLYGEESFVEASCTEAAHTLRTCQVCADQLKAYQGETLPHEYARMTIQPSCIEGGYTIYECTACKSTHTADETPALGHDTGSMTVLPNCTEDGYTLIECYRCGSRTLENEQPAFGHDYVLTESVAADCKNDGYKLHTCTRCEAQKRTDEVSALGHSYSTKKTVTANCTRSGYKLYECKRCGKCVTDDTSPVLNHLYSTYLPWDVGSHISVCDREDCNASILVECTIFSLNIDGETIHYCPICGHTDADDSLLRIIDNASAIALDAALPEGTLILRRGTVLGGADILCIVFEHDGKAEPTYGSIRISLPAETLSNVRLVQIDESGAESELVCSESDGIISFDLDFSGETDAKSTQLIRLIT